MPPLISVITPSYNPGNMLEVALDSVAVQDYAEVEHIVVDGGSTDGTVELLGQRDGIRWVSEPDRGLAHAMNKGFEMASGDIVGELNADDIYLPGTLAAVAEGFERNPDAEWLTGRCPIIGADGEEIRKPITAYKNFFLRHYSLRLYLTQNFVSAPATFFRTEVIRALGGFDERYTISVDYDLQLKLARRGDPVVLDRDLACFRMVEGTLSMSGFEQQFREHTEQARRHGDGHPIPVAANRLISRMIVWTYRGMRAVRRPA